MKAEPHGIFPPKEKVVLADAKRALAFFLPMMRSIAADVAYYICYKGGVINEDAARTLIIQLTAAEVYKLAHLIERAYGPWHDNLKDPFLPIVQNLNLHRPDTTPQALEAHQEYVKFVAHLYDEFIMTHDNFKVSLLDAVERMQSNGS